MRRSMRHEGADPTFSRTADWDCRRILRQDLRLPKERQMIQLVSHKCHKNILSDDLISTFKQKSAGSTLL